MHSTTIGFSLVLMVVWGCQVDQASDEGGESSAGAVNQAMNAGELASTGGRGPSRAGQSTQSDTVKVGGQQSPGGMTSESGGLQSPLGGNVQMAGARMMDNLPADFAGREAMAGGHEQTDAQGGQQGGAVGGVTASPDSSGQGTEGGQIESGGQSAIADPPLAGLSAETGGRGPRGGGPTHTSSVGYCIFQHPGRVDIEAGSAFNTFGVVFVEGITDRSRNTDVDLRLRAQVGYGPRGTHPADHDGWRWQEALANPAWDDRAGGQPNNDEYTAQLRIDDAGDYDLAYRFNLDGEMAWLYCDKNGSDDGYTIAEAVPATIVEADGDRGGAAAGGSPVAGMMDGGELVGGDAAPMAGQSDMALSIGYCRVQESPLNSLPATRSFQSYGIVFVEGLTDQSALTDADPRLRAEVGYGPRGSDPSTHPDWQWRAALPNPGWNAQERNEPGNDEYYADLVIETPGEYDLAYRFTVDDEAGWLYCDRNNGSTDGYSVDQALQLTITAPPFPDYCHFQHPLAHTAEPGQTVDVYGILFEPGLTTRTPQVDLDPGLLAQAGYGRRGTQPADDDSWVWVDASANPNWNDARGGQPDNDEYVAALTVPVAGLYDMAYRFSLDFGSNWLYCDTGDGSTDGYDIADAARLTAQ